MPYINSNYVPWGAAIRFYGACTIFAVGVFAYSNNKNQKIDEAQNLENPKTENALSKRSIEKPASVNFEFQQNRTSFYYPNLFQQSAENSNDIVLSPAVEKPFQFDRHRPYGTYALPLTFKSK